MTYRSYSVGTTGYIMRHRCTTCIPMVIVTPSTMTVAHNRYSAVHREHCGCQQYTRESYVLATLSFDELWCDTMCYASLAMSARATNSVASFEHAQKFYAHRGSAMLCYDYPTIPKMSPDQDDTLRCAHWETSGGMSYMWEPPFLDCIISRNSHLIFSSNVHWLQWYLLRNRICGSFFHERHLSRTISPRVTRFNYW